MWKKVLTPEGPADKFGAVEERMCRSGSLAANSGVHTRCHRALSPSTSVWHVGCLLASRVLCVLRLVRAGAAAFESVVCYC
jgi:hypothetical protein